MSAWFETLNGAGYGPALWIVAGLLLLLLLLGAVKLLRRLGSGTFVAGGRNRRTRLAVMDAAAVDAQRRLVLVRRDDVEHLILIGGPTDLLVERDIRTVSSARRQPAEPEAPSAPEPLGAAPPPRASVAEIPRPRLVPVPTPPAKAPQPATNPARNDGSPAPRPAPVPAPAAPPARSEPSLDMRQPTAAPPTQAPTIAEPPRLAETAPAARAPEAAPAQQPYPRPTPREPTEEEEALMRDIQATLDADNPPPAGSGPDDVSLEEEMSRLLGDLSKDRR